jgi:hypothetical protein
MKVEKRVLLNFCGKCPLLVKGSFQLSTFNFQLEKQKAHSNGLYALLAAWRPATAFRVWPMRRVPWA